jgi:DNA-binding beta-propeller fold protein YncE
MRLLLAMLLLATAMLGAIGIVGSSGCDGGGVINVSPMCDAAPSPTGMATARIYAPVVIGLDGGVALAPDGSDATALVLPGGRLLSPVSATFGELGFPVSVVTHPALPVAYAVDMDYAGYDSNARCNLREGARVRGVHVMDLTSHKELQGPTGIALPPAPLNAQFLAPPGVLCTLDAGPDAARGPGDAALLGSPHDTSYGIAISHNAPYKLYTATGVSGLIYEFNIDATGRLHPSRSLYVGGYPAGIALSPDDQRLWVVEFVSPVDSTASSLTEVLLGDEGGIGRQVPLPMQGGYGVAVAPGAAGADGGERLFVTGFRGGGLYSIQPELLDAAVDAAGDGGPNCTGQAVSTIPVGTNPEAVVVSPDGKYVYVSVSDDDTVVAVDTTTCAMQKTYVGVALPQSDVDGGPLQHGSSASALALDPVAQRLYVACSEDNAVTVLSTAPESFMQVLGAIPVGFYPTGLALTPGGLVVTHGKGLAYQWQDLGLPDAGLATAGYQAEALQGSMLVAPTSTNLTAGSAAVARDLVAPSTDDSFSCQSRYPVPLAGGGGSPISHIVLIVRENKTYDFLLGGEDGDPAGAPYQIDNARRIAQKLPKNPPSLVPNIKNLANQYASANNFYANSEVSMIGHAWLTSSFVNDYLERAYTEAAMPGSGPLDVFDFTDETGFPPGLPGFGTFFTHLLENNVDFLIMGELTGIYGYFGGQFVLNHFDVQYPGLDLNLYVSDIDRATYAVNRLVGEAGSSFPSFVYMELPRDHTLAMNPGVPTPAYMIAENDEATGRFVAGISQSPAWDSTAIFIVEDDPQDGYDHVDYHRTICVVASPWVAPHTLSQTHYAFPSLFRTFELILNIPPMNRFDALARPMRDLFTGTFQPHSTYKATSSNVSLAYVDQNTSNLETYVSSTIDFSHPDQGSLTGEIVWKSLTGEYPPGSRLERMQRSHTVTLPAHGHVKR